MTMCKNPPCKEKCIRYITDLATGPKILLNVLNKEDYPVIYSTNHFVVFVVAALVVSWYPNEAAVCSGGLWKVRVHEEG